MRRLPCDTGNPWGSILPEHHLRHILIALGEMHGDARLDIVGQLVEVAAVVFRQNEFGYANTARSDDLFADAAHRQHLTGQGQLTRHGERALDSGVPGQ